MHHAWLNATCRKSSQLYLLIPRSKSFILLLAVVIQIHRVMILFSFLSGGAGLEVRGPGVGQDLPVGLPHRVHTRNRPHLHPSPTGVPLVSSSSHGEGRATLQLRSTGLADLHLQGIHVQKNLRINPDTQEDPGLSLVTVWVDPWVL